MQNYMVKPAQRFPFSGIVKAGVSKLHNRFKTVPLERQLSSQEMIQRLEIAINLDSEVAIQVNPSFESEAIEEYRGNLFQTADGRLYVYSRSKRQTTAIQPENLRHISFAKKAS